MSHNNMNNTPASSVISDSIYQVLRGCVYGSIWGMVTPFHPPGSTAAIQGMEYFMSI